MITGLGVHEQIIWHLFLSPTPSFFCLFWWRFLVEKPRGFPNYEKAIRSVSGSRLWCFTENDGNCALMSFLAENVHRNYSEQDRKCTFNVTLRRVRATIVAVEKQSIIHNLSVCICSLRYPTCNAHAPYCHVACPPLQYFSTLSHKRHDFRNKKIRYWMWNVRSDFL